VGLANTIGFRFSQNMGRLEENLVFLELKRKEMLVSNLEIYYWKDVNHREVDFLKFKSTPSTTTREDKTSDNTR
ncbi:unnamed protein product, partial [marine sediment metagenome]